MLHSSLSTCIHLSSAHYSQSNSQTEWTKALLEQYLHCYINYQQDLWALQLLLTECAYNNAIHASTQQTPFIATYGHHPQSFMLVHLDTNIPTEDLYI